MTDTEIEKAIRRAGYDVRWDGQPGSAATTVFALRDGKRHTRSQPNLLALGACRVARFRRNKYVQLVGTAGHAAAMYELRTDGIRRTSKGNLPAQVVAAFGLAER